MKPLFKYAGGKSSLAHQYFKEEPINGLDTVFEPFAGALGFTCHCINNNNAQKYIAQELNGELVEMFKFLKHDPDKFVSKLIRLMELWNRKSEQERSDLYYYLRDEVYRNDRFGNLKQSVIYLFLLKTNFQGLSLFKKDQFNNERFFTARGNLNKTFNIPEEEQNLNAWVEVLKSKLQITESDFADLLKVREAKNISNGKNLYFIDPPYQSAAVNYGGRFKDEQHESIFDYAKRVLSRGKNSTIWIAHTKNDFYEQEAEKLKYEFEVRVHYFDYKHSTKKKENDVVEMLIVVENKK